ATVSTCITGRIRSGRTCTAHDLDQRRHDHTLATRPRSSSRTPVGAGLPDFDVLVAMRERTRFPAEVLERLPHLRLLVTTGPANAAIDLEAARRLGITVSATGYD